MLIPSADFRPPGIHAARAALRIAAANPTSFETREIDAAARPVDRRSPNWQGPSMGLVPLKSPVPNCHACRAT